MTKFEKEQNDFLEARKIMIDKYGRDYMNAITKLNNRNLCDEDGFVNSECFLTDREKDVLIKFNPELASIFETPSQEEELLKDYTRKERQKGKQIDEKYLKLLLEVMKKTINLSANPNREIENVNYQIVGISSQRDEIVRKYGEEVYRLASENNDLVCLMLDGKIVTSVISLKSFMKILSELKNIPSYIDHSNNTFHYNAIIDFKK